MTTNPTLEQRSTRPADDGVVLGTVASNDGTTIGYRRVGSGPALVVVAGAMISSRSHLGLAHALADAFTVYLPDRRGRGLSGPYGAGHCMQREVEDLDAIVGHAGAQRVYAVSVGALIVAHAALGQRDLTKLALYEPALVLNRGTAEFSTTRLDDELARGDIAAALITGMKEAHLAPPALNVMPRFLLERLTVMAMNSEERKAGVDDVTMRMLAPTLPRDFRLIRESEGRIDVFTKLSAEVLLLGGSKSDAFFKTALDAVESSVPNASRIELPGLGHGGSTDRDGKPELVASALRDFFG